MPSATPRISVRTDLLDLQITLQGGTVVSALLLDYPADAAQPEIKVNLLEPQGEHLFIAQSGLLSHQSACLAQSPDSSVLPPAAVREAPPLYPRGPWLRIELCCLVPSWLTTTPSVSPAGTLRFRFRLYAAPSLCGSA